MASPERLSVPDTELSRPALVLAQRFVQRWDLHAHQLDDGSYVCVHEPLNVGHLLDHLRGEITLGAYLLDQNSQARFLALDADDEQKRILKYYGKMHERGCFRDSDNPSNLLWLFDLRWWQDVLEVLVSAFLPIT